jgi:hypothetical protein
MLGEITSRALNGSSKATLRRVSGGKKRKSSQQKSPAPSPVKPAAAAAAPLNVFVRCIPGAESLSLSDSIKVAAKIKLRSTTVPRSPGGTPLKGFSQGHPSGLSSSSDSPLEAMRARLAARRIHVHGPPDEHASAMQKVQHHMASRYGGGQQAVEDSEQEKENWDT